MTTDGTTDGTTGDEAGAGPSALDQVWRDLVAVAVLGTERRDPPRPPGPLADLIDDLSVEGRVMDGAGRLLAAVAATAAVRRAAFVPLPPADRIAPPEPDDRPWCPPEVMRTWRSIVSDWPVLEDEWLRALAGSPFAPGPELTVELLLRHRTDPARRAVVLRAVGPMADWLVDHVPSLAPPPGRRSAPTAGDPWRSPRPPLPPELERLLGLDHRRFVVGLAAVLEAPGNVAARRPFLVGLVARCDPAVLDDVVRLVDDAVLSDLAGLRRRMLEELDRSEVPPAPFEPRR